MNLGQVVFAKFPLFVLGFILMFVLGSTGVFAPAQHYQGKYFDNSEKALVKTDKDGKVTTSACRTPTPRNSRPRRTRSSARTRKPRWRA